MQLKELQFSTHFVDALPADSNTENHCRAVEKSAYSFVAPTPTRNPRLLSVNSELAISLGFSLDDLESDNFLKLFSGNALFPEMKPYAMCYGGHQFGQWAGQLGDGRAINLGELSSKQLGRQTVQLKGAGKTPYSRHADGVAVLRSSIREYLCSEAIFHLGIPTTRALSLSLTGDEVVRDKLYDGNAALEPCAVVCRISPSFLRFGSLQLPASRGDEYLLKQTVEYSLRHHFPHIAQDKAMLDASDYLQWFKEISEKTADMIVNWMRVGFVHGVMNTDNMSLLGETIDYGPYGWIDDFDLNWTPNTSDAGENRYRFGNQFKVSQWNLFQLANAIFPLINEVEPLQAIMADYAIIYQQKWQKMMASKLGFKDYQGVSDQHLFEQLEALLSSVETDMALFYRQLATYQESKDPVEHFMNCYYQPDQISTEYRQQLEKWLGAYQTRLSFDNACDRLDSGEQSERKERIERMNRVNPLYVLRNYLAQQAITQAEQGDYSEIEKLASLLKNPYQIQAGFDHYAKKRPDWAKNAAGCSQLSCSS